MRVVITGGGGFIGQKLAQALGASGRLRGHDISEMILADVVPPKTVEAGFPVKLVTMDIGEPADVEKAIPGDAAVVFHLAAIVSGQAEAEFDLGMRVNMQGTHNVLERCRALAHAPVVVYSSSVAVYGGDTPVPIDDRQILNPQTSYGAQKAIGELLLTDYSRKGFLDGRGLRLPTVSVRPGKPNAAASSFLSSIFREPLQGEEAICPVTPDYPHWVTAPRNIVKNLVHAAELDAEALGQDRCLGLPGLTTTVGDMIEAMRKVAGEAPVKLIRFEDDPVIGKIAWGWKAHFNPERARRLGFVEDKSFEDNIRWFLEDDVRR